MWDTHHTQKKRAAPQKSPTRAPRGVLTRPRALLVWQQKKEAREAKRKEEQAAQKAKEEVISLSSKNNAEFRKTTSMLRKS